MHRAATPIIPVNIEDFAMASSCLPQSNHVATGSRASAVAAVYNKAQKLPERAAALDAWARMVTQDTSKVVTLRQA